MPLANWKTFVVILVATPVLYFLHTRVLKRIGDRFVEQGLPNIVNAYRVFLKWMLQRDYSVKRAMFRNTFALVAFTGGVLLAILGGLVSALAGGRILL